ncbi:hypothetical protein O6H91_07G049700 [Diphasiastrum complanatum]|uniref:Uncharacterized protein n=3 Tax=Diphasiastrum complanatum TaxID=34168 RepID=A0ACC2D5C7_DIPCM|nr:hypothetical protein O6H91_07G049700 [Diphasiastrum complanatum]
MFWFEQTHGGRRLAFELRLRYTSQKRHRHRHRHRHDRFLTFVVVDSATCCLDSCLNCAAVLVPRGQEHEWIYCSEGGQWQLLASASAARLVLVSRSRVEDILHAEEYEELLVGQQTMKPEKESFRDDGCENGVIQFRNCRSGIRLMRRGKNIEKFAGSVVDSKQDCRGVLNYDVCDIMSSIAEIGKMFLLKGERLAKSQSSIERPYKGEDNSKEEVDRTGSGNGLTTKCWDAELFEHEDEGRTCNSEYLSGEIRKQKQKRLRRKRRWKKGEMVFQLNEDKELKEVLTPLMSELAPKANLHNGHNVVPFLSYEDDVVRRFIVEEAFSPLIGPMVIEDVEVALSGKAANRELADYDTKCKPETAFRRRLRFKRMPNLIQTEVSLVDRPSTDEPCVSFQSKLLGMEIDVRRLVHVYLPPVVAGLVLVSPCLEACLRSANRARVLVVGIGGGALPLFLHHHFQFDIQAVDLDETVLAMARRHFGLVEDHHFQIAVSDGLRAVMDVAEQCIQSHLVSKQMDQEWQEECMKSSGDLSKPEYGNNPSQESITADRSTGLGCGIKLGCGPDILESSSISRSFADTANFNYCSVFQESMFIERTPNPKQMEVALDKQEKADQNKKACDKTDPRVHVIIIDVDADNARFGLDSPPQTFLETDFLLAARTALHEGGMLVMNVLPSGERSYVFVVNALKEVFAEVYEIKVGAGDNYVVFALPDSVKNLDYNSVIAIQVRSLVEEQLIGQIQKAS